MNLENRYLVFKRADIEKYISLSTQISLANVAKAIEHHHHDEGHSPLECIVIESDWPEYKPTLAALEKRVNNEAASKIDNKHYCNDGYWWEMTRRSDNEIFITIGQNNHILKYERFLNKNEAYKQKNKWLTKYNMFCPE